MKTPWDEGTDYGSAQLSRALQDADLSTIEGKRHFVQSRGPALPDRQAGKSRQGNHETVRTLHGD